MLPNTASAWWSCPTGYKFEQKNKNKVRCYRPAQTYEKKLKSCPKVKVLGTWVGSFYKRDYIKGREDSCTSKDPTGVFTIAVPHSFCSSGYKHIKLKGKKDRCLKKVSSNERAPTKNVR